MLLKEKKKEEEEEEHPAIARVSRFMKIGRRLTYQEK